MIIEGQGKHFDPVLVEAFVQLQDTFRNIALTFADYEEERQMLGGGKDTRADQSAAKPIETILLVEDNDINREIMQSQLTAMGYRVDLAVNGVEALKLYQQTAYDVILTDIEMPEMNGYELTAEIRRLETDSTRSTLILALTASEFDLNEERAIAMGFNGYMLKPLELDVLKKKLAGIGCGE
jgi:CheY-like chemotaxis protein